MAEQPAWKRERGRVISNMNSLLKFITCGSVDDGKSTLIGHMLYDAKLAQVMAAKLLDEGIYVIGFFYPVVAKGLARIRVQISAGHSREDLDKCIKAFIKVGKELKVV